MMQQKLDRPLRENWAQRLRAHHLGTSKASRSFISDRALQELLLQGILLILEGEQHIMDQQDDLNAIEKQEADDITDISTKFDAVEASVVELQKQLEAGNVSAALAEAQKGAALIAALRGHVDSVVTPPAPESGTGEGPEA